MISDMMSGKKQNGPEISSGHSVEYDAARSSVSRDHAISMTKDVVFDRPARLDAGALGVLSAEAAVGSVDGRAGMICCIFATICCSRAAFSGIALFPSQCPPGLRRRRQDGLAGAHTRGGAPAQILLVEQGGMDRRMHALFGVQPGQQRHAETGRHQSDDEIGLPASRRLPGTKRAGDRRHESSG